MRCPTHADATLRTRLRYTHTRTSRVTPLPIDMPDLHILFILPVDVVPWTMITHGYVRLTPHPLPTLVPWVVTQLLPATVYLTTCLHLHSPVERYFPFPLPSSNRWTLPLFIVTRSSLFRYCVGTNCICIDTYVRRIYSCDDPGYGVAFG